MKTKILMVILAGLLVLSVSTPVTPAGGKGAGKPDAKGPPAMETITFANIPYWSSPPWYPEQCEDTDETYRLIMGGLHWAEGDLSVDCVVYTADAPIEGTFDAMKTAFGTWDDATSTAIYGSITENTGDTPPGIAADGINTVSWGPIDGPGGIIAQTSFSYWPNTKELAGFDIVFDEEEPWSVTGEGDYFDVQNVMTHELGHTLALDDLRSPRTGALTMHAYTWPGDTGKRTLGAGDILGIQAIYGQ